MISDIFMRQLVEQSQKININDLVKSIKSELKYIQLKSRIEALGQTLEVTTTPCHFGNSRYWFICPLCKQRVGTLFKPPDNSVLLCRKCHNLTYLKSRYNRMIWNLLENAKNANIRELPNPFDPRGFILPYAPKRAVLPVRQSSWICGLGSQNRPFSFLGQI